MRLPYCYVIFWWISIQRSYWHLLTNHGQLMLTVIYVYMCVCILMDSSGKLTLSSGKSLNIISKSAISHISMLHSLIGSSGHQMSSIYPPVSSNMARWQNDFLIQTLKICRIFMDFPATFDDTPGYPLGPIGIIQKKPGASGSPV